MCMSTSLDQRPKRLTDATPSSRQQDIEETRAIFSRYNSYRVQYLPFLFSIPLAALANTSLPQHVHHRVLLAMLIGFGLGIPCGELSRLLWLRLKR